MEVVGADTEVQATGILVFDISKAGTLIGFIFWHSVELCVVVLRHCGGSRTIAHHICNMILRRHLIMPAQAGLTVPERRKKDSQGTPKHQDKYSRSTTKMNRQTLWYLERLGKLELGKQ